MDRAGRRWSCRCSPAAHIPAGLTAGLSQVLFPVVLLLSLTGLFVGILQSYDEFTIPALAPAVWNLVILVLLVVLHSQFHGENQIYAYAIAWLVATVVQLLMVASALRRIEFRLSFTLDWRDPRVRQVLLLFLPVTISIGIVNLDIFINAGFGVARLEPRAARRSTTRSGSTCCPQGIFSVAVATVLFPTLSRLAARRDAGGMRRAVGNGIRQINLLLIPSAALLAVLATPITRLLYQHGSFGAAVHAPDRDGAVLVLVQPAVRRRQPAADADVLRAPATVDPDQARGDEHGRRRDRERRPVQAARDRRPGDRHGGRQHRDDRAPAAPAAGRASTAGSRAARR